MHTASRVQEPGPLSPWVRQMTGNDMSHQFEQGQEALMASLHDAERFVNQNANTLCIAGCVLGTFIDRRFFVLPLAIGALKLYRSMQESQG